MQKSRPLPSNGRPRYYKPQTKSTWRFSGKPTGFFQLSLNANGTLRFAVIVNGQCPVPYFLGLFSEVWQK